MKATYKVLQDEIELTKYSDPVTLWFFGDVHRDTAACDVDRWKYFLKTAKDTMDENTYFICMGDTHDFASTREKRYLSTFPEVHGTTSRTFDLIAEKNNRDFAAECSFMRGRLLGIIEGNHSWIFENGKTSVEDLAERLDSKDMGWLCHYSIIFRTKSGHIVSTTIHLVLCHGKAGGKTVGATVNQIDDLRRIFPIADIYCFAHDHQRIAQPVNILVPTSNPMDRGYFIKQKRQLLCRSGSFMKGYHPGSNSYEIFRLLRPSDLGALKVTINFRRDQRRDSKDVHYTEIVATI